jgi:hypothetical protein
MRADAPGERTARGCTPVISLRSTTRPARLVAGLLAGGTVVVMLAFIVVFALHRITPVPGWKEFFDIGGEANLPTWWNSTLLALVAVAALAVSMLWSDVRVATRRAWWVVAAAATYLSIDEAAGLHERLAGPGESIGIDVPTYAWILPGTLLAGGATIVLVAVGRHLPRKTAASLAVALGAYAAGALGFEAVNGWIRRGSDDSPWYTLGTIVEESLEMGACILAVTAIVDTVAATRRDDTVIVRPRHLC